ncbi:MAG: 50S ribosomal protein L24 [Gammaproteobacteria bacterium]|nr:50S ribosomal protein L24 [Gammaproteobacteria bacterium]
MNRLKKGDDVVVISGKDKGRRGTVLRVLRNDRVVVENVNVAKKHTKPNPQRGVGGGIVEREMSIHGSNVMLFNPATGKGGRIGFRQLGDGRKVRFFKANDEVVDA